jgi:hypothetical protein
MSSCPVEDFVGPKQPQHHDRVYFWHKLCQNHPICNIKSLYPERIVLIFYFVFELL